MHEEREGIVVLKNSFHGRTLGALHFTRQESVYQNFPKTSIPVYMKLAREYRAIRRDNNS